ncbi:DUF1569 domain-containing protein [Aquimarina sp. 2-A2]|uniref:Uncharacterized protein DUF1569 n=1 Tax=Aquimarina intermedia TaxID=350814 RepID=A0A5S5C2E2_9FLAO|nr:DUF1569 domain-containing protein [Aquimarina intermedia]TYP73467.1 uncharacterized protein DUF1569 [Aquimarina intermedia]
MKSLFDIASKNEIEDRIHILSISSPAQWGKMDVAQMLHHCQFPLRIALNKEDFKLKSNWIARVFFKKLLYNDTPWRKGLPTAPNFKVKENKDFDHEKTALINYINEFYQLDDSQELPVHPVFGKFTRQQWGQMQYKHLDHHLKQFKA